MSIVFPGESAEYRTARERLLEQEIALRRQMEAVAAARRALPPGGPIPRDYLFEERGADGETVGIGMSELFAPGRDSLVIYTFMFPRYPDDERPGPESEALRTLPLEETPCPSCTAFLDQLDAVARHAGELVNIVAAAEAPVERLTAFADERGWRTLRLVSTAGNSYKVDYNTDYEGARHADAQRLPSPGRDDPPFLGIGALLGGAGAGPGPATRRHAGDSVEPARPDAGRAPGRLARADPLRVDGDAPS